MSILNKLIETSSAMRVTKLEFLQDNVVVKGDFEGSVTGYWKELAPNGTGVVIFNKKEYATKPVGFTSLPAGTEVELSHANGTYYSKF